MKRRLLIMLAAMLLAGCSAGIEPPPTPTPTGGETVPPLTWDPVDNSLPDITEPSGGARRVTAAWVVGSIDYLYTWVGLGS